MTKVKTILAEFCTAKDILAINRLGLLKKDERESQPIPWRHRLPCKERRELVRSELRMSSRPQSNRCGKEVARALSSARTVKDSKLGECLLNNQSKADSMLVSSLRGISGEERRSRSQLQQLKKSFLRQSACLNHEPLILVERPASPKVKSRAAFKEKHGVDPILATMPSHRRPLTSRSRTPSTLTTIEAFTVETRRKKNVWEEAVEDREERKFKSTSRPSARLTEYEKQQLKIGHALHKPTQESIASLTENAENDDVTDSVPTMPSFFDAADERKAPPLFGKGPSSSAQPEDPFQRPETIAEGFIFVTQLSNKEFEKHNVGKSRLRSVTFSDVSANKSSKKSSSKDNKKLLLLQENGEVRRRLERPEASTMFADSSSSSSKSVTTSSARKMKAPSVGKTPKASVTVSDADKKSTKKKKKADSFFSMILNHGD